MPAPAQVAVSRPGRRLIASRAVISRRLRATGEFPALQILHISNTAITPEDRIRGLEHADVYLVEPVEAEVLIATVHALIENQGGNIRYVKATGGSATGYSNLAFCEELAGRPEAAEGDYQRGLVTLGILMLLAAGIMLYLHQNLQQRRKSG